jgi:UMF1 family MFS transporter
MTTSTSDALLAMPKAVRARAAWAIFEWGRNPYSILVTLFIYSSYFTRDVVGDPVRGQALWGTIVGNAGLVVAVTAPFLGAIADAGGRRKPWIAFFVMLLALSSAGLWFTEPEGNGGLSLFMAATLIVIANVAYDFSMVFHGSMLPSLTPANRVGRLSGLGYALGNFGGILLLGFALAFFYLPEQPLFGLDKAMHEHERIVGPMCALWLCIFCIPFFLFTPDRPALQLKTSVALKRGFANVLRTVRSLKHYRNVGMFLAARALYNDGKTAMLTFGGVYASGVFQWGAAELAIYGIIMCLFAAFGALVGGRIADAIGAKTALVISITGTALGGIMALGMAPTRIFFFVPHDVTSAPLSVPFFQTLPELLYIAMVAFTAVCIVAAYANSRTMLARIAPHERMTEFFGLYALSGEATAFLAPLAVAAATIYSGSQQWGMAAIVLFLMAGLTLLLFVKEERCDPA